MKRLVCLKAKNGLGRFAPSALPHYGEFFLPHYNDPLVLSMVLYLNRAKIYRYLNRVEIDREGANSSDSSGIDVVVNFKLLITFWDRVSG